MCVLKSMGMQALSCKAPCVRLTQKEQLRSTLKKKASETVARPMQLAKQLLKDMKLTSVEYEDVMLVCLS